MNYLVIICSNSLAGMMSFAFAFVGQGMVTTLEERSLSNLVFMHFVTSCNQAKTVETFTSSSKLMESSAFTNLSFEQFAESHRNC